MGTMTHRVRGIYKMLERPRVYQRVQTLLGGGAALERFVREFVRPVCGTRLLDVGCGAASLLHYLPEHIDYVGYDLNSAYIEAARRSYGLRGRFVVARIGEEPDDIALASFDTVVAVALLHHLTDAEADHLARMAARMLASGGSFVTIDPVLHSGQGIVSRMLARLDRGAAVRTPSAYRDLLKPHFAHVEQWLLTDMLTVPYSHCVLRGSAGCGDGALSRSPSAV